MHQIAASVYSKGLKVADIDLKDGRNWAGKPEHFVWIGLHRPDAEALLNLQQQFDLHELAMQDALATHTRSKLETFGDALFMVLYSPVYQQGELQFVETQLFAGSGYIISAGYGEAEHHSRVRRDCEARPVLLRHGEDYVLYALLCFITENYRPLIEHMHVELDVLDQRILERPLEHSEIEQIQGMRRDLQRLRRYLGPLVEICQELQNLDFPFIDRNMRPYFRDVAIHVQRVLEDLRGLQDMADHVIEIGLLLEASRQSVVQRKFAAWAAILAFPTAVAGIYGMNFRYMPELDWQFGYFAVLGVIGLGCITLFANFKRLDWL